MPVQPTLVDSNSAATAGSVTTFTCSYPLAQTTGNCNLVCVTFTGTPGVITSVTDTTNNTYTVACPETQDTTANKTQAVYIAQNIASHGTGNVVTVTLSSARTFNNIELLSYSNVSTTPLDGANQKSVSGGGNALSPSVSITTTVYNDVIVSFLIVMPPTTSEVVPFGYSFEIGSSGLFIMAADGPATTPGPHSTTWALGGARSNVISSVALSPPAIVPSPSTLPANFITDTTATLNGIITSTGSVLSVSSASFDWGLTTAYGNTSVNNNTLTNGSFFSHPIMGLQPNSTYHFRTRATTTVGTGSSADATFITNPTVTPPVINAFVPGAPNSVNYTLSPTFSEEFNSPFSTYDTTIAVGTWRTWFYYGAQSSSSSRVEGVVDCIMSDTKFNAYNPFSIANSCLTITANNNPNYPGTSTYPYLSGLITTQNSFSQTYGYFEIQCQTLPMGVGIWPAFWMLSTFQQASEEIDIMEDFALTNSVTGTIHYLVSTPHISIGVTGAVVDTTAMHTYGMLWTAADLFFYIDQVQYGHIANPGFNDPEYILATLQTGAAGSFLGTPTVGEIPCTMVIDYIRAYSLVSGLAIIFFSGGTCKASLVNTGSLIVIKRLSASCLVHVVNSGALSVVPPTTMLTPISLPPSELSAARLWYFLRTDNTIWAWNPNGGVWTQVANLPGGRFATSVYATSATTDPLRKDVIIAVARDGSIWSTPVSPISWTLMAQTP